MRWLFSVLAMVLAACATAQPINAPLTAAQMEAEIEAPGRAAVGEDLIVLALSGGGARAASFHLGVLQGLRDMRGRDGAALTQHIALITSVSGGSVLAAYYGLHGDDGLDSFRTAYLDKEWRLNAHYLPPAWMNLARGGVNGPSRLADWLDREVYDSARMRDLRRGPRIVLNATDMYNATPFAFTQTFFDSVCSDVAPVRVADAVAASMAVPVMFRPVLVESFAEACTPDAQWTEEILADRAAPEMLRQTARAFRHYRGDTPAAQRYVHLSDGGVVDYLGLTSLNVMRVAGPAPAPLTPREAVQARRVLVLAVNAEHVRARTWQQQSQAPGLYETLYAAIDGGSSAAMRSALDAFRASLPEWERDLVQWRCAQTDHFIMLGGGHIDEPAHPACRDIAVTMEVVALEDLDAAAYRALFDTETAVSLPPETVDALIAAGREVAARNEVLRALRVD